MTPNQTPPVLDYRTHPPPPPLRRPRALAVIAIIGIIVSPLSILVTLGGTIRYFTHAPPPRGLIYHEIRGNHLVFASILAFHFITFFLAIQLFIGSLFALKLKPSARRILILYVTIRIPSYFIELICYSAIITPAFHRADAHAGLRVPSQTSSIFAMVIIPAIWFYYLFAVLIILNRPAVRQALAKIPTPPPPPK